MTRRRLFVGAMLTNLAVVLFAGSVPDAWWTPLVVYLGTCVLLLLFGFWLISEGEWPEVDPHDEVNQ